ncbi:hypothetical protein ASF18_01665 [Methylobacterium sp. Leaf89]|nr:hypothetical protein ASF18_01665 [Methylobacterium sp. Leaf89]
MEELDAGEVTARTAGLLQEMRRPGVARLAAWAWTSSSRPRRSRLSIVETDTQAEDDPISDIANSRIIAQACERAGVRVEAHALPSGGHGFGMGRPGTPSAQWPGWCEAWLRTVVRPA